MDRHRPKTGTLHLDYRSIQKRVMFREGLIATSWSNEPRESLGQFLIREGLVSEEQLFKALVRQEEQGRLLGSILISDRALERGRPARALKAKAEETVYDLFLWPEGQFEFKEGEFPGDILHHTSRWAVTGVILEGIRRVDEWERIRSDLSVLGRPSRSGLAAAGRRRHREAGPGAWSPPARASPRSASRCAARSSTPPSLLFDLYGRASWWSARRAPRPRARDPVGAIQDAADARLPAAAGEALRRRAQGATRTCWRSIASTRTPRRASSR